MMGIKRLTLYILMPAVLLMSACGYRFAGTTQLPTGIRTLHVDIFENRTADHLLNTIFPNDIIEELMRNAGVESIAPDKARADAVLSGKVWSVRTETISTSGFHTAVERRVEVVVTLSLTRKNGEVIWSYRNYKDNEEYRVEEDKLSTEQSRLDAIRELSTRIGERVYQDLTSGF